VAYTQCVAQRGTGPGLGLSGQLGKLIPRPGPALSMAILRGMCPILGTHKRPACTMQKSAPNSDSNTGSPLQCSAFAPALIAAFPPSLSLRIIANCTYYNFSGSRKLVINQLRDNFRSACKLLQLF